jgi:hypothetical protein
VARSSKLDSLYVHKQTPGSSAWGFDFDQLELLHLKRLLAFIVAVDEEAHGVLSLGESAWLLDVELGPSNATCGNSVRIFFHELAGIAIRPSRNDL